MYYLTIRREVSILRLVRKAAFAGYIMYISFIFLIGNAASFQNLFNDIYFVIGTIVLYFSIYIKEDCEMMTVHRYGSKINFALKTIGNAVYHASVLYFSSILSNPINRFLFGFRFILFSENNAAGGAVRDIGSARKTFTSWF